MKIERWKDIPGYEGMYQVSNMGRVRRQYNMTYGTGHKRSAETQIGRVNTKSSKRISQYDLDGKLVFVFPSAADVKRKLGYNRGHVSECARGECKQAYGYIWRYE